MLAQPQQQIVRPTFKNMAQSGMKVGGVW
jgi:hypothetical protein